jgi:hypothetical protein
MTHSHGLTVLPARFSRFKDTVFVLRLCLDDSSYHIPTVVSRGLVAV